MIRSGTFKKNTVAPHSRKLYKNGALLQSDTPSSFLSVTGKITIGTTDFNGAGAGDTSLQYFGDVDDVRFYLSEIPALNIKQLFDSNYLAVSPVAYYQFGPVSNVYTVVTTGAFLFDSSISGNPLTWTTTNAPVYEQDYSLCQYKQQVTCARVYSTVQTFDNGNNKFYIYIHD
jgi:hypothetical protein